MFLNFTRSSQSHEPASDRSGESPCIRRRVLRLRCKQNRDGAAGAVTSRSTAIGSRREGKQTAAQTTQTALTAVAESQNAIAVIAKEKAATAEQNRATVEALRQTQNALTQQNRDALTALAKEKANQVATQVTLKKLAGQTKAVTDSAQDVRDAQNHNAGIAQQAVDAAKVAVEQQSVANVNAAASAADAKKDNKALLDGLQSNQLTLLIGLGGIVLSGIGGFATMILKFATESRAHKWQVLEQKRQAEALIELQARTNKALTTKIEEGIEVSKTLAGVTPGAVDA